MTAATGKGTAMHVEFVSVRFIPPRRGGVAKLDRKHIPEIRKLLRTAMSISAIASHFGVSRVTMMGFIKRNQICDMKTRQNFISLQNSLAREERREASK